MNLRNKKGLVTIFVIIGIVIVAAAVGVFIFRGNIRLTEEVPGSLKPVYDYYLGCVENQVFKAVSIAETQGGKIYVEDYYPGSEYAPFSSHLNFLGFPVPYWYYISANGVIKEQVPSMNDIESEVERYLMENIGDCDFDYYREQGYSVNPGEAEKIDIKIGGSRINVVVGSDFAASKNNESFVKREHNLAVQSRLGKYYNTALEIYDKQKTGAFLENYSVDVLRFYAPVDGVEITCSPKIWKTREVVDNLQNGLEANIGALRMSGVSSFDDPKKKYFEIDYNADESVRMIYSKNWPTKIEINGDGVDQELMVAEPVGTQQGLGIMGFCYVPYHFVYDLSYPVLIQIYDDENPDEVFQFPVVVIIDKNVPRQAVLPEGIDYLINDEDEFDLCAYNTQDVLISVYDSDYNKINDAFVNYECFDQRCSLGKTLNGRLVGKAPGCVNGYLHVRAENYSEKKQLFSTNKENLAEIFLDKEYGIQVEVLVDGRKISNQNAVVSFVGINHSDSATAVLPELNNISLSEGKYDVKVYVYSNSSLVIPGITKTQCTQVPSSGIAGLFGGTREKCFNIEIPETNIDYALTGGGNTETYLLKSQLEKGKLILSVQSLAAPRSLDELQSNYITFETRGVIING